MKKASATYRKPALPDHLKPRWETPDPLGAWGSFGPQIVLWRERESGSVTPRNAGSERAGRGEHHSHGKFQFVLASGVLSATPSRKNRPQSRRIFLRWRDDEPSVG